MVKICVMSAPRSDAAAASRDAHLTLRRVERQQRLVEILCRHKVRRTLQQLADELGVTQRTIARDVQRLRSSGVPIDVAAGRGGGALLRAASAPMRLTFDLAEIAALVASLAALGPTVSESSRSAMAKLTSALADAGPLG